MEPGEVLRGLGYETFAVCISLLFLSFDCSCLKLDCRFHSNDPMYST